MSFVCSPLSIVTGDVCPNYKICRRRCVLSRSRKDEIVGHGIDNLKFTIKPKRILIIGGGPAGIACAHILHKHGHKVIIAERESSLGGALNIIPKERLPRHNIENLIRDIEKKCEIRTNCHIKLSDIAALRKEYDFVILATGTPNPRKLGIEGEGLPIVTYSSDFLHDETFYNKVVVIGGGDVAMDCALHARKLGSETIVAYRKSREFVRASAEEVSEVERAGAVLCLEHVPHKIKPSGIAFKRGNEEIFITCDRVVVAIGQTADLPGIEFENVFTAGDANLGPSSVAAAVTQAKELAYKIS